jgi:hypothetical protein
MVLRNSCQFQVVSKGNQGAVRFDLILRTEN